MNTRNYLFLLGMLVASNVSSQEQASKFYWGITASAENAYRTLAKGSNTEGYSVDEIIEYRNSSEQGILGYRLQGRIGYRISAQSSMETGVSISRIGYGTEKQGLTYVPPTTVSDPNLPTGFQFRDNFYSLSIPLSFNYTIGKKRLKFISSAAVSFDYLILQQRTSISTFPDNKKNRNTLTYTPEYNRINITPELSVGISYDLNEKLNLRIQPAFHYGLLDIIDAPITANLWSAGLNCGLYFNL